MEGFFVISASHTSSLKWQFLSVHANKLAKFNNWIHPEMCKSNKSGPNKACVWRGAERAAWATCREAEESSVYTEQKPEGMDSFPCASLEIPSFQPIPLQLLAYAMSVYKYQFKEQFTGTLKK